jgi:prepilin-type N-terminal cleavage/methylation domain-containing protein
MQVHEFMPLLNARPPVSRPLHDSSGFTLIELVAVIALLAIMASVAVFSLDSTRSGAEEDATRFEMSVIRKALLQFKYDVRHFPDAAEKLDDDQRLALLMACQADDDENANFDVGCEPWDRELKRGWNGPYLSIDGDKDVWKSVYRLIYSNDEDSPGTCKARIVSNGPNLKPDDGDDIALCVMQ